MRRAFAGQLTEIEERLGRALGRTPATLVEIGDVVVSPSGRRAAAISGDAALLRSACRNANANLTIVTARQSPVAGDLRVVLALLELARHGELLANQFQLISEQLAEIGHALVSCMATTEMISQMTTLASAQLQEALNAFASRNMNLAQRIDSADDALDRLNREVFETALERGDDVDQRELAMRHVLIARSVERIGDNAVDIAEQAAFVISARLREFSDASRGYQRAGQQLSG